MKNYLIILLGLLLFSCQQKEKKVIDIHSILPQSERNYDTDSINEELIDSNTQIIAYFSENGIMTDDVTELKNRLLPNRFGPESTSQYQIVVENDTVNYYKWSFSDSTRVMNAFFNWIDCFGEKCKSFKIGDEKRFQPNALQIYVSDTTLIYIDGAVINNENWNEFHTLLGYEKNWNYYIEQRAKGKARWFTYKENKKNKLNEE